MILDAKSLLCATALFAILTLNQVNGHGRLWDPPSRSTMWRQGYKTAHNYNDNQLNCGGFATQWGPNGGKCGICGDPYQGKRDNEAGGKYASGIITRRFKAGQVMEVDVQITANHKGWSEFRICPNNDVHKPATQQCLDKYLLELADGSGTRYTMSTAVGHFKIKLKLPDSLTCTQCVLQWKWHAGNSWGTNPDGTGCIGCGSQEEFYGCADIAIDAGNGSQQTTQTVVLAHTTKQPTTPKPTTTTSTPRPTTPRPTTPRPTTPRPTTQQPTTTTTTPKPTTTTTTSRPTTSQRTTTTTTTPRPTTTQRPMTKPRLTTSRITTAPAYNGNNQNQKNPTNQNTGQNAQNTGNGGGSGRNCRGSVTYRNVPGMVWWCTMNCARGYCPRSHCECN